MPEARFGSFDDLLAITSADMQPIMAGLRVIITDVDPDAVEVVRMGDRAATYGVGPKKMSEGYAYLMPHENWVNLGFYKGALLPDPAGLMEGTGAKMRHVKVRSLDAANQPALRELLQESLSERRRALDLQP